MPRTPLILSMLLASGCATSAPDAIAPPPAALFSLSVEDAPAENGKKLNMALRELSRDAESSLVEVTFISGGSVSSSMFILRGMCGLMRARGENYFVSERVSKSLSQYRITFPKVVGEQELRSPDKKPFSAAECSMLRF